MKRPGPISSLMTPKRPKAEGKAMDTQVSPSAAANARRAAAYIENRVAAEAEGPVTLDELARHCDVSPWHLQRQFKQALGVSPRQYDDALRMKQLKRGLKRGDGV